MGGQPPQYGEVKRPRRMVAVYLQQKQFQSVSLNYIPLSLMKQYLHTLETAPDSISFNDTISVIDANYDFTPSAFRNGEMQNEAGQNNGSCKVFSFARLHHLTPQQTLYCFGSYYRDDVLKHPQGSDHQNIRKFIKTGWDGIVFAGDALKRKKG
jgi:hypothetical protein